MLVHILNATGKELRRKTAEPWQPPPCDYRPGLSLKGAWLQYRAAGTEPHSLVSLSSSSSLFVSGKAHRQPHTQHTHTPEKNNNKNMQKSYTRTAICTKLLTEELNLLLMPKLPLNKTVLKLGKPKSINIDVTL